MSDSVDLPLEEVLYTPIPNPQIQIPKHTQGVVVLTGASTGIGFATLFELVKKGYFVFATVRKTEDAQRLKDHLKSLSFNASEGGFAPLLVDICDVESVKSAAYHVETLIGDHQLKALINNAGIALGGPLLEISLETMRTQLDVNLTGQLAMIQAFAPLLGVRLGSTKGGRIIQVSSVSGVRAMPFVGPYTASKFALEGFSDALRMELMPYGVDVIIIQPGPIATEIWDKAPRPEDHPFPGSPYQKALEVFYDFIIEGGRKGYPPSVIAKTILKALQTSRPKTRYVKTPGYFIRYFLPRWLPTRWFDWIIAKKLRLSAQSFHHDVAYSSSSSASPTSARQDPIPSMPDQDHLRVDDDLDNISE